MRQLVFRAAAPVLLAVGSILLAAGCSSGAQQADDPSKSMTSKPADPDKAVTAGKVSDPVRTAPPPPPPPPLPPPVTPRPAVVDKTPIKADLSKIKFTSEPAELFGYDDGESRAFYYTAGKGELALAVPAEGTYEIAVTASCQAALNENAKFILTVDGNPVGSETTLTSEDAKDYLFKAPLKAGERRIGVQFTNDAYKENEYDRNFYLNGLRVVRVE